MSPATNSCGPRWDCRPGLDANQVRLAGGLAGQAVGALIRTTTDTDIQRFAVELEGWLDINWSPARGREAQQGEAVWKAEGLLLHWTLTEWTEDPNKAHSGPNKGDQQVRSAQQQVSNTTRRNRRAADAGHRS